MASPKSFGLFHAAIAESSPLSLPVDDMATAKVHYQHVVDETHCKGKEADVEKCLMNLTWLEVVKAQTVAQDKVYHFCDVYSRFLTTRFFLFESHAFYREHEAMSSLLLALISGVDGVYN